jgi:hypothetical protein
MGQDKDMLSLRQSHLDQPFINSDINLDSNDMLLIILADFVLLTKFIESYLKMKVAL